MSRLSGLHVIWVGVRLCRMFCAQLLTKSAILSKEGARSAITTMQGLGPTHRGSGTGLQGQLAPHGSGYRPCPCCFDLDTASALQNDGNMVHWDNGHSFVRLWRYPRRIQDSAVSGCQICSALFETLVFFGIDFRRNDRARHIELRIPNNEGSLEITFYSWAELTVQLYACMCL